MSDDDLSRLRAELDEIDQQLLGAVARRQRTVRRIGELKRRAGKPVFDRERERAVVERVARSAEALGVDPKAAQQIFQVVLESSHTGQEKVLDAGEAEAKRFLIVGGGGRMGRLFTSALERRGHRVEVREKDDPDDAEQLQRADVVIVSVPMALAAQVARELGPRVRSDALLCDFNSLKVEVCEAYGNCAGEALGLHPMFGPSVRSLRRQKVVVCPVKPGPLGAWFIDELGRLGLERIEASPAEHDRMMAVVQVLVHFRTLVMGEALRRTGVGVSESLRYTSPIYRLELAFVGRLFAQNPDLYAEIEMQNPFGQEVRAAFRGAAEDLAGLIDAGDREGFRQRFRAVTAHFGSFGQEAMSLSDTIIDTLSARP